MCFWKKKPRYNVDLIYQHYDKILHCITSCNTIPQLYVTRVMIKQFYDRFMDSQLTDSLREFYRQKRKQIYNR